MKDYALAALAGIWLTDGITLLIAPRFIITQVRELLQQSPSILRWELLAIIAGAFLFFAAQDLPYRWLWMVTAGGMVAKGLFLSFGSPPGVSRSSPGALNGMTSTIDSGDWVSVRLRP